MIRTFHSIGQGAFYTEMFKNFSIVYDCGSTRKNLIIQEIKTTFNKDEDIDAVFISHFDFDHVSGLEFLLDYCNVKRLVLPLLNDNLKIEFFIHNYVNKKNDFFIDTLIDNPRFLNKQTQIILIEPELKKEKENIKKVVFEQKNKNQFKNVKFTSNQIRNWVFIPFNFQNDERALKLRDALLSKKIKIDTIDRFKNVWSNIENQRKIKNIYQKLPGGINTNSMTLFSGPESTPFFQKIINQNYMFSELYFPCKCNFSRIKAGCLYFGDFDAKKNWNKLGYKYKEYWKLLGIVQIPHHGSSHNYNSLINYQRHLYSIISAGIMNRDGHPHPSTIRSIIMNEGIPLIVNEYPYSRIFCNVFIH